MMTLLGLAITGFTSSNSTPISNK